MSKELGPHMFLEEITGLSKTEILAAAHNEFERMVAEGMIYKLVTPFGDLLVIDHPLLKQKAGIARQVQEPEPDNL